MPSSSNKPQGTRDPLELKGDQSTATDEQIRQHCPELFDNEFYLEPLRVALNSLCHFTPHDPLVSSMTPEGREKLAFFIADLKGRIQSALSRASFDYAVGHESKNRDAHGFSKKHEVTTALNNVQDLLSVAEQPLRDMDQLNKFSALIGSLLLEIKRAKEGIPNFEENNRRHEIKIEALKGDVKKIETQPRENGLTRAEQTLKERLEEEIVGHEQNIAKNSIKLNKKKDRVAALEKQLTQIVQGLSGFLAHYDPHSPESMSDSFGALMMFDKGTDLKPISAQAKAKEILSAQRNGTYTSHNPFQERAFLAEEKKGFLKKWGSRAAIFLMLSGGGLYMTHEKIKKVLAHADSPVAERILGADEKLRVLKAEHDVELKSNPTALTLMKQKLLDRWVNSENETVKRKDDKKTLSLLVLAANSQEQLIYVVLYNSTANQLVGEDYSVRLGDTIDVFRGIFGNEIELTLKVGSREDVVYRPGITARLEHHYDLKFFYEISVSPALIIKKPIPGGNEHETVSADLSTKADFDKSKKLAKERLARADANSEIHRLSQSQILESPIVKILRGEVSEKGGKGDSYVFGSDFQYSTRSPQDLNEYLKKAIPKLEKDPKVIEYVTRQVRKGPHFFVVDKGVNISPVRLQGIKVGDPVRTDDAVQGMISLGMHEQLLDHLKGKFGPKTTVEIALLDDSNRTEISLRLPFNHMWMSLSLSNIRKKCGNGGKVLINVEIPFEDGDENAQYARFAVPMLLSEMKGSSTLKGSEGKLLCDELETYKIPGFNGSLTKLIKYMKLEEELSMRMMYATHADELKENMPEILELIKNNPQFKKDLAQALSEVSPKVRFEHYIYDEAGNFERRDFDGTPITLHNGPETLKEKGSYIGYGAQSTLIPHLEKFFGEGLVDVRLHGIAKEKTFCESSSEAKLEIIIRPTQDHSFSVFYPINLKKEGASAGSEFCLSSTKMDPYAIADTKELIDSLPLVGFLKYSDVPNAIPKSNVMTLHDSFKATQKENDGIFGKTMSLDIMKSYAVIGINRELIARVKDRFGEKADARFLASGPLNPEIDVLTGADHAEIINAFRFQALCNFQAKGFAEVTDPNRKSVIRIPVFPGDLLTQNNQRLCIEAKSLTKPNLHAMTEILRVKADELSQAKIRVLDTLGGNLEDWQKFGILVEVRSLKDLRRFINDILPGCTKRVYMKNGRKLVHLEPHPDNVEAMKLIYGKDTVTSLQFFVNGKPDGEFVHGKYRTELDIDFDAFCDFDNIASLIVTRNKQYSPDTLWIPGFYNEICPDKTYEVRNPIDQSALAKHNH